VLWLYSCREMNSHPTFWFEYYDTQTYPSIEEMSPEIDAYT
jgi:hypothetical protein